MASETYTQIRTWIDSIFKINGRKFITGLHANEGFKKVLSKSEELKNSKGKADGIATLDSDGKVPPTQLPSGNDKGYFANYIAIASAIPEGQAGWFVINGETDTVWVWDTEGNSWTDTDNKVKVASLLLKAPTITTWNAGDFRDNQIKTTSAAYYQDAAKTLEQRFDWNEDLTVKRIEIKDSLSGTWVQRNCTWTNDLPEVAEVVITEWTIV